MRFAAIIGKSIGYGFTNSIVAYTGGIMLLLASYRNFVIGRYS